MKSYQLKQFVIEPILKQLNLYSEEAADMLCETAAAESLCGNFIRQIAGPACGVYQMEPATAEDIYKNYLAYKPDLFMAVRNLFVPRLSMAENLTMNLAFATAMCRIHYLRVKQPIPKTVEGRAGFWKKYYNTPKGKGTIEDYLTKVKGLC